MTPRDLTLDRMRAQAFADIIKWLQDERKYQAAKFDYGNEPPERLRDGLSQGSWFWEKGVLNYTGRVRLYGLNLIQGRQALMKVIGSLVNLAELSIIKYGNLPDGGYTSGTIFINGKDMSPLVGSKTTDNQNTYTK